MIIKKQQNIVISAVLTYIHVTKFDNYGNLCYN